MFAANVAAVSGFTSICFVCDELSKWRDADSGANPATEVLASLRPTTATQPGAIEILCSSPFGLDDAHAKAFDDGETEDQCVAEAPTWLANPSISEADTHKLERDERVWRREYAAIPQAGAMGAFDDDAVERAVRTPPTGARQCQRVTVIDASSGRKDSWTFARCGWDVAAGGARVLVFDSIDGFDGSFWK